MVYRIKDWAKHFEKADTRRCKTMSWVPVPTKQDGSGYRAITNHERKVELFAAWILIVETAAKMPTRGLLAKDGKPLSARSLHLRTGFPESIFDLAFKVLVEPDIDWLEAFNSVEDIPIEPVQDEPKEDSD